MTEPGEQDEQASGEFESLLQEGFAEAESGSIVTGVVVSVSDRGVVVDVGLKSEGVIPREEFSEEELGYIRPGDEIYVYVARVSDADGIVVVSREKARRARHWDRIVESFEKNEPVEGRITGRVKGGFSVDLQGVPAFLPGSQVDVRAGGNPDRHLGEQATFKILRLDERRRNVIVSRRAILEAQIEERRKHTAELLKPGAEIDGTVKNVTEYGAFIDLGGIDGLLHVTDMSWGRIKHPSEKFQPGDPVRVVVLQYAADTGKVSLGFKQRFPDPWSTVESRYPVGSRVEGRVVGLTDYGVFVEIEEGVEGLVHISELKWGTRPRRPADVLKKGDTVQAVVLRTDSAERRVSLSIKQLLPNPWERVKERFHTGQIVRGRVKNLTDFGAFVQIEDGIDGLIHVSDMSWTRHVRHPGEMLKKNDEVEAVILSIDPSKERMSLGLKQLGPDPWLGTVQQRIRVGEVCTGRIIKVVDFGIFVELEGGVEGLVYASEYKDAPGFVETLHVGDAIEVRVLKVDPQERKIGLGLKGARS